MGDFRLYVVVKGGLEKVSNRKKEHQFTSIEECVEHIKNYRELAKTRPYIGYKLVVGRQLAIQEYDEYTAKIVKLIEP